MGGQQSQPALQPSTRNGVAAAAAAAAVDKNDRNTGAGTNINTKKNRLSNGTGNTDHNDDDDDDGNDCQMPCFWFTPNQLSIPFLRNQNKTNNRRTAKDRLFGSPVPDTPNMERRLRQEVTKKASTVLQRETHHRTNTDGTTSTVNTHQSNASASNTSNHHHHRLSDTTRFIPPLNNANLHIAAATEISGGSNSYTYSNSNSNIRSTNPPPPHQPQLQPQYPEAEIYEGDDCEEKLYAKYELLEVLGVGSTSTVHKCRHRQTGIEYACKIIDIHNMDTQYHSMMTQFHTEITSLKSIHHPGIIQLYDVYILSTLKIFIVMELMQGGELFDYVVEKGTLSEEEAAQIVRTVLVRYHLF
jgi:Protein kinase domain